MSNPKSKPKTKSSSATGNGKHLSRAEIKERLLTGRIVSAQCWDHSLARIVEPADAEAGMAALRGLSGIEKARQLFRQAGLAFPTIPKQLAARFKERGEWLFATRELKIPPYNFDDYVPESHDAVGDYAVLCHSGYGVNSYAIQYYLVYGPVRMFLFLGWGGVYMNAEAAASKIRECFSLADEIVPIATTVGQLKAGERVTIVGSDSYNSYWFVSGQSRQKERGGSKGPAEVLTEVLHWLKSSPPNQLLGQTEPA
jgi:hypothetical protein